MSCRSNGTISRRRHERGHGKSSEFGPCHLVTNGLPGPGTWAGDTPAETAGTFLAAGDGAAGPAQFTYDVLDTTVQAATAKPASGRSTRGRRRDGTINVPWR